MDVRSFINLITILCVVIISRSRSLVLNFDDVPTVYTVRCQGTTPTSEYGKPNESIYYELVEMMNCDSPSTVYIDVLQTLKLKMPWKLRIFLEEGADIRPHQFEGLQIKSLDVRYEKMTGFFNTGVLTNLTGLEELYLYGGELPPLPPTMIKRLQLWQGNSIGSIGHCEFLEKLTLVWWNIDAVPGAWLRNCTNLRILSLKQMPSKAVTTILSRTVSITELYMYKCQLLLLSPDILATQADLRKLHAPHNRIKNIVQYHHSPHLEDVDLSYNELSDLEEVVHFLGKQKDIIVNFTVANNRVLDVCQKYDPPDMYLLLEDVGPMPNLKSLSLAGTSTTELCLHILNTPSLEYLDLSKNKLTALEFQHLPLATAKNLKEINLKNVPIRTVDLDKTNYEMLLENRNELKLSGLTLTLDCDCDNAWLARAVRNKLISVQAYCKNEKKGLEQVPIDNLECDKFNCENCVCRRLWQSGDITAYCNGEQSRIPKQINLTTLIAPGNLIADFNATDLTDELLSLDLRKNHISKLDANVVEALFSVSERRLNFSGNPIVCDCDNVPLLEAFKKYRLQVEDFENITCVDDGRGLDDLNFEDLCAKPLDPRIMIFSSFLLGLCAVLAIMSAFFLKYERQIKVFLYARGCCLWWIREDEVDADRPFDAFISFAHEDDDFVMGTLMTELEHCGYRLCVHYRDWLPGEWIPMQITRSIELSRRTIIVLSKSFLESVWGLLEFRLAHVSTLKEGRPRIIVLMLEDIEDKQMDDELRGYLKSNTYVKWGEGWFWDKLKYALPHKITDGHIEMQNIGHPMVERT